MSLTSSLNVYRINLAYYLGFPNFINTERYYKIKPNGLLKPMLLSTVSEIIPIKNFTFIDNFDELIFKELLQNDFHNYCLGNYLHPVNIYDGMETMLDIQPIDDIPLIDIFGDVDFETLPLDMVMEILNALVLDQIYVVVTNPNDPKYGVQIWDPVFRYLIESDGSIRAGMMWNWGDRVIEAFPLTSMFSGNRENVLTMMETTFHALRKTKDLYQNLYLSGMYLSLLKKARNFLKR